MTRAGRENRKPRSRLMPAEDGGPQRRSRRLPWPDSLAAVLDQPERVALPRPRPDHVGRRQHGADAHPAGWLARVVGLLDHRDPVAIAVPEPRIPDSPAPRIGGGHDPVDRPIGAAFVHLLEGDATG